jgi:hypothetical protein
MGAAGVTQAATWARHANLLWRTRDRPGRDDPALAPTYLEMTMPFSLRIASITVPIALMTFTPGLALQ